MTRRTSLSRSRIRARRPSPEYDATVSSREFPCAVTTRGTPVTSQAGRPPMRSPCPCTTAGSRSRIALRAARRQGARLVRSERRSSKPRCVTGMPALTYDAATSPGRQGATTAGEAPAASSARTRRSALDSTPPCGLRCSVGKSETTTTRMSRHLPHARQVARGRGTTRPWPAHTRRTGSRSSRPSAR